MEKIEKAVKLISDEKTFAEGEKLFNRLCLSKNLPPEFRLMALAKYVKNSPVEGLDMLSRFRDMLPHLSGEPLRETIKILVGVTRSSEFSSHERVMTAVTLWNNNQYHRCYACFADLVNDRRIEVKYRVEASRYLIASENEENIQISQEALLEIIDSKEYSSSYRYSIIAGFIGKTGISTILNAGKLKIPYDEDFVYVLQTNFFYGDNEPRERVLSGQHLIQMECVDSKEKEEISNMLLEISNSEALSEDIRADAADVVLRLGVGNSKVKARDIIRLLGRQPSGQKMLSTVYSDSQNVHNENIIRCVSTFIEKIISETSAQIPPFQQVYSEIGNLIRQKKLEPKQRISALKSLNRVSVDSATFTENNVNLAEILIHVWVRIQGHPEEEKVELEKRLIEELVDMSDTCSSGHCARFVNILSTYDVSLRISWEEQIEANVSGRMQARIRDIQDDNLRTKIVLGMLDDSEEEDRQAYVEFVKDQLKVLEKELFSEFVGEGYISEDKFKTAFEKSKSKWELKDTKEDS